MKEELKFIGERIMSEKEALVEQTYSMEDKEYGQTLKNSRLPGKVYKEWRTELIEFLGMSLLTSHDEIIGKVRVWANKVGSLAIENGAQLDQTIRVLAIYRTVIWDCFTDELAKNNFSAVTMLDVSKIINPVIDEISFVLSHIYADYNQKMMEATNVTLKELSVPVVPLGEKAAILPLIGEIDTYRSQLIMETALQQSTKLKLENLVIDVSGVPIVDTIVAHNLFQIVHALKLLGVDSIITGIRPEIAQTMVTLGIEFKEVHTLANLKQALEKIGFMQS
ncbi:STAS domain-containing protein [Aquibacillus kalidii]|uniref:STAS domain-containing protein n=1 Tax=Aquibacillus kalidii TaxID=2762597 RepID=UPI00164888EB|nr:STAS domain-containing protein [Aquibacillus kalidii]